MRIVTFDLKVFSLEVIDFLNFSKDFEFRERPWFPLKLYFQRLNVIQVNVGISQRVYEVTWLQACDVCDHVGEQGVAGDVEGHTQSHVSRPLVQLAGQLPIYHVELAKGMAWGEGHEREI